MGQLRHLWLQWKMLRLPWRKKFFVGQDLQGNTFWEFRDPISLPSRPIMRRIVHKSPYAPRNLHHADIEISPQWHQWLRQTRTEAPSLEEQQMDLMRQEQLKINARLADERWEAKARYIEKPKAEPKRPMDEGVMRGDVRVDAAQAEAKGGKAEEQKPGMKSAVSDPWEQKQKQQTSSNPSSGYQPESWTPAGNPRKR